MNRLLPSALLALVFAIAMPGPVQAAPPPQARAYAPENLRSLSRDDQVRVISLEYSEQSRGRRIPDDQLRFYLDQVSRSDWGFSRIKQDIARSLSGSGDNSSDRIRCESDGNRPRSCRTPWQGRSRLVRQLSDSPCIEGRSWRSQFGQIYVSNGCRGEFASDAQIQPPVGSNRIRCESDNNRSRTCRTPWQGRSRLVRQLSDSPCIEGRSWQSQRGQIHVNGGCRGEFASAAQVQPGYPDPGNGYSVSCASNGNNPKSCAWDKRRGRPYLQRQLSTARCRENDSWWYDGNAIWVRNGCRALFGTRAR